MSFYEKTELNEMESIFNEIAINNKLFFFTFIDFVTTEVW